MIRIKDEKPPLVSVIVITYNQENYVRQALDSIFMQKVNFKYEVLIGDDCSSDGTPDVLREYSERYPNIVRLYLREKNLGASRNVFELLMQSKGAYLAFCEGDDYWISPYKLQKQVDFLENHTEFIGCAHKCLIINENGEIIKNQKLPWVKGKKIFSFKDFNGIFLPGQTATIVKRNIFLNNSSNYEILFTIHPQISDRISNLLYLLNGDFYYFHEVLSAYRKRTSKNVTSQVYSQNIEKKIFDELKYTEELEHYATNRLGKEIIFDFYRKELYCYAIINLIRNLNKENLALFKKLHTMPRMSKLSILHLPFYLARKLFLKLPF